MRRTSGLVLLVVGVFLLALAPLLRWTVYPSLAKAPIDQDTVSVSTGPGTYLDATSDPATLRTGEITVSRSIVSPAAAQAAVDSSRIAVWQVTTVVDSPQTIGKPRPQGAYSWLTETWSFDRTTGKPTADSQVQAEAFLKFPFNTQKRTYSYWDGKAGQAFPAQYQGTERFQGRTVYRFLSVVPPTEIPSPLDPSSTLTYQNPASIALVDPTTGVIVSGSSHQMVSTGGQTIFDAVLAPNAASTADLLKLAKAGDALALMRGTAPVALLILGALFTALAVWLLAPFLNRRRPGSTDTRIDLPAARQGDSGTTIFLPPSPRAASEAEQVRRVDQT